MSGHSKWSTIKHKKGAADAKRGKLFTRLIKEITVAARLGGSDPDANPRLRKAIATAKQNNMPQDNVTRAIKKGTGDLPGASYEDIIYEGYGPEGTAVYLETMTDNKNRTVSEIRFIFNKYGGNLGENGCVAWMFDRKGIIVVEPAEEGGDVDEDALLMAATEAGAEDMTGDDGVFEIVTAPEDFDAVLTAVEEAGFNITSSEINMVASTTVDLEDEKTAEKVLKFMDVIEDHDDVNKVYSNFNIPDSVLEALNS